MIQNSINELIQVIDSIKNHTKTINDISNLFCDTFNNKKKILICGNGGSAADAQHMATELVCTFNIFREALPAYALTTNTSILTAWGNDYTFDDIFSRQISAFGEKDDVLLCLTTSGNSQNIINAIKEAKNKKMKTVALIGRNGGKIRDMLDISIIVDSFETPRIQEAHLFIEHIICGLVEKKLWEER